MPTGRCGRPAQAAATPAFADTASAGHARPRVLCAARRWDWHGSWGNPEVYYRAHRYITSAHPYWNASGGADHVWAIARDAAACDTPWGSLLEELKTSIILSNWGGVTGLSGRVQERCFAPGVDIVVPGTLTDRVVAMSPFWLQEAAIEAQ